MIFQNVVNPNWSMVMAGVRENIDPWSMCQDTIQQGQKSVSTSKHQNACDWPRPITPSKKRLLLMKKCHLAKNFHKLTCFFCFNIEAGLTPKKVIFPLWRGYPAVIKNALTDTPPGRWFSADPRGCTCSLSAARCFEWAVFDMCPWHGGHANKQSWKDEK